MTAWPTYWQASPAWSRAVIAPRGKITSLHLGAEGCVVSTGAIIRQAATNLPTTPLDALALLADHPGALTDTGLVFWPEAAKALGLVAGDAIAWKADAASDVHEMHEFAGHIVDANADLAGELAAALIDGFAAVRVSTDGSGLGRHTIACLGIDGTRFVCSDPALARIVLLDENLEAPDVHWGATPRPYRAVGIRPLACA